MKKSILSFMLLFASLFTYAVELEFGTERVEPGIVFVFEGAIKDIVIPSSLHLSEQQTHVHIEARVNWDKKDIPKGAVAGGFIPYLRITAQVINEKTGLSTSVDVTPHINLIDNFHYARNISLPGNVADLYKVIFTVSPPSSYDLAIHKDWADTNGNSLLQQKLFVYKNINFKKIADASRR